MLKHFRNTTHKIVQEYLNDSKQVTVIHVAEYETLTERRSLKPSVVALYVTVGPCKFSITGLIFG